jgi:hypothetical protein
MKDTLKLIGKGRGGWHASGVSQWGTVSCSSYDTREEQLLKFAAQAEDGALVYDASKAGPEFEIMVVSGPMFDPRLPPDGVDRFTKGDRSVMIRMMPGFEGGFKDLAEAALSETYCGFDKVGSGIYESIISAIPGVRVGHVREGKVVWKE